MAVIFIVYCGLSWLIRLLPIAINRDETPSYSFFLRTLCAPVDFILIALNKIRSIG